MSPRKPNLESTIYLGSDGRWHGRVTMGVKENGSPDRRHRRARTESEIKRKVKALEALRDKVHRILSRALKIAHRRRIIGENIAILVDPPSVDETEANPFTQEQAKAFLVAAAKRPTFMRWIVGVGMGFRQGETLGLRWSYVDLDNELIHPRWQLQRLTWRHGCPDPHACGGRLHRFDPCPPNCPTHKGYTRAVQSPA